MTTLWAQIKWKRMEYWSIKSNLRCQQQREMPNTKTIVPSPITTTKKKDYNNMEIEEAVDVSAFMDQGSEFKADSAALNAVKFLTEIVILSFLP